MTQSTNRLKKAKMTALPKELNDALAEDTKRTIEDTKIYGDDWEETMRQHLDLYTGCSLIMLVAVAIFMGLIVAVSLFMGPN